MKKHENKKLCVIKGNGAEFGGIGFGAEVRKEEI
jgi:hypothetical protein